MNKKVSLLGNGIVMLVLAILLFWFGGYALDHSQLADPKQTPVRFSWVENGVHRCVVIAPKTSAQDCSSFTGVDLSNIPFLYEAPPKELLQK